MSHGTPAPSDHGHAAVAEHGHAEFPQEPAERFITPAPEDFRNLPGAGAMFWPFLWVGLAVLLIAVLLQHGWPASHADHAGETHETPAHGEPAHR